MKFCLSILFLFFNLVSYCQTSSINRSKKNIEYSNKLLEYTKSASQLSINTLRLLQHKIDYRNKIVNTLNYEIKLLNNRINEKEDSIKNIEVYLDTLTKEYERMIYYAFKNKNNYDRIIHIFSSDNFSQTYKRLIYFKQYSTYRQAHVDLIKRTKVDLREQIDELTLEKKRLEQIVKNKQLENSKLKKEKDIEIQYIQKLSTKSDDFIKLIDNKNEISKILDISIQNNTISKDIEDDRYTEINKNFRLQKGRFNWPLDEGIIISKFGKQSHPFLKGIKIINNGIDIGTTPGSQTKAIYKGLVSKIVTIPGANKAILISHGDYFTLYSNLIDLKVNVGDSISANQVLGTVYTNSDDNITLLQFQIWYKNKKLNPIYWIRKNNKV